MNLKETSEIDPNPTPILPRQYHERTGHTLKTESNILQELLDKIYADENKMKVNETKTKIMIFIQAISLDDLPRVSMTLDKTLEVVEEMKLLGIMIRSDMKWSSNTRNLTSKCYQRMWMLRNLKRHGANENQLLRTYYQQIRSIAEMACPVWNGGLTLHDKMVLERIQKTALAIIMGSKYTSYSEALSYFEIETLETRREALCLKFALKAYKSNKFSTWFSENEVVVSTTSEKLPLKTIKCRTRRYQKSPLPYLTELLNSYLPNQMKAAEESFNNLVKRLEQ